MESWTSYMIEGTKIRLLNNTTKNIEDLTTNDELIVMNASDPSFDAANLQFVFVLLCWTVLTMLVFFVCVFYNVGCLTILAC